MRVGERSFFVYRTVSSKLTSVMAGNVLVFFLLITLTLAQYNDDSDYNDYEFYDNIPRSYKNRVSENYVSTGPDDFYMISEIENNEGTWNSRTDEIEGIPEKETSHDKLKISTQRERDWFKEREKIYRYTKHRIPGYDYDELEFKNGYQRCDDKSLWTNCVCQFTCQDPSVVDCFTPCKSGCECKEDFVFDEQTQDCILPQHCPNFKDYFIGE